MHENLLATREALRSLHLRSWVPIPYPNRRGVWGISVRFWHAYQHHMISIHNCETVPSPRELSELLAGIESIDEYHWGVYVNSKVVPGFYASARSLLELNGSTNHWYMIARSPERHFARLLKQKRNLSEDEQDLILYLERSKEEPRLCA